LVSRVSRRGNGSLSPRAEPSSTIVRSFQIASLALKLSSEPSHEDTNTFIDQTPHP
jgi:hypothetical protein